MTHIVPCEDPANDPDDWFIEKDGRQYVDDDLIPESQRQKIADAVLNVLGDDHPDLFEEVEKALDLAEDAAAKAAQVRRRHAKDKCHVECYFRTQCLGLALAPDAPPYGTWGGYYQEEIKQIRAERDRRLAVRSHDADVGETE